MNHKIVSFYHKYLNPEIKELQKKVFDKLESKKARVDPVGSTRADGRV